MENQVILTKYGCKHHPSIHPDLRRYVSATHQSKVLNCGPVTTSTRDAGCEFTAQLLHQTNGSPIASGVSQIKIFKLRGGPTHFLMFAMKSAA